MIPTTAPLEAKTSYRGAVFCELRSGERPIRPTGDGNLPVGTPNFAEPLLAIRQARPTGDGNLPVGTPNFAEPLLAIKQARPTGDGNLLVGGPNCAEPLPATSRSRCLFHRHTKAPQPPLQRDKKRQKKTRKNIPDLVKMLD